MLGLLLEMSQISVFELEVKQIRVGQCKVEQSVLKRLGAQYGGDGELVGHGALERRGKEFEEELVERVLEDYLQIGLVRCLLTNQCFQI